MYGLYSLQGQFTGFHSLFSPLKAFTVSNCFNSLSKISYILGPRKGMLSVSLNTLRTFGLANSEGFQRSQTLFRLLNISLINEFEQLFNISIASARTFLICIVVVFEVMIYYHYRQYVDIFRLNNLFVVDGTIMAHPN